MAQPEGSAMGYFGLGKQGAWDSGVAPSNFSYYRNVGPDYKGTVEPIREGGGNHDNLWSWLKSLEFDGSFEVYARTDFSGFVYALCLGKDEISGASDPYTHTITPEGQGVPTSMEFTYGAAATAVDIVRLYDGLITGVTLAGDISNPPTLKCDYQMSKIDLTQSAASPSYETPMRPPVWWDGVWTIDGSPVTGKVTKFSIDLKYKTFDDIRTDTPTRDSLTLTDRDVSYSFTMYCYNKDFFRKVLTGTTSGTTVSNWPITGSFKIKLTQEAGPPERSLEVDLPLINYTQVKMSDLDDDNKPLIIDVSGVAMKGVGADVITVKAINATTPQYLA